MENNLALKDEEDSVYEFGSAFEWKELIPTGILPAARTGHDMIVYKDILVIFGGTDGKVEIS